MRSLSRPAESTGDQPNDNDPGRLRTLVDDSGQSQQEKLSPNHVESVPGLLRGQRFRALCTRARAPARHYA